MIRSATLRPGLLVSLKTTISGNVKYSTRELEAEHTTEDGAPAARWETERTILDPAEHEAAKTARSRARSEITRVCSTSAFGLLCPQARAKELEEAIVEARKIAAEFNARSTVTEIGVYVITGRIADNDAEAIRALNSEVSELLERMQRGVEDLDVKSVRDAAARAKALGQMLSDDASARLQIAIDTAREAARKIAKAGEGAAIEIDRVAITKIGLMRTAFLDLDEPEGEIAAPQEQGRAIDLAPIESEDDGVETAPSLPAAPVALIEMEG